MIAENYTIRKIPNTKLVTRSRQFQYAFNAEQDGKRSKLVKEMVRFNW